MFELTLLIGIILVIVLALRRNIPVVLENPLIIQRTGEYYCTIAPRLNQAQTLLEQIAQQFAPHRNPDQDSDTLYYRLHDPRVHRTAAQYYLLALTLRHSVLYFQVLPPAPPDDLNTLKNFTQAVLTDIPPARNAHATTLLRDLLNAQGAVDLIPHP